MSNSNCIFCKIAKGEIPTYKVYEDRDFLAFLDITPQSPGHVQVIPKEHYRWVWDVPGVGKYFEVVRKIAKAQQKAFDTDWVLSKIVGEDVYHAHFWVYPGVKDGDPPSQSFGGASKMDFKNNAEKIKSNL